MGDVTIVQLRDARVVVHDPVVREFGAQLRGLVNEGQLRLLIHPDGVEYASSSLLATLAWMHRRVVEAHGFLRLYGLTPVFRDLLRSTALDRVLEIHETEADALAAGDRPSRLVRTDGEAPRSVSRTAPT